MGTGSVGHFPISTMQTMSVGHFGHTPVGTISKKSVVLLIIPAFLVRLVMYMFRSGLHRTNCPVIRIGTYADRAGYANAEK